MNKKILIAVIFTLSFLTACAQTATPGGSTPPGSITTPTPVVSSPVPTQVVPTPTHIPVDRTPAQLAAIQEVSKKYNIPAEQIQIANTEAVTWPTGCLGVVLPGVMCTDVVTPGFRIMLTANGQQFEIHTNQDGSSVIDAAQQLATLGFVVQMSDHSIQVVNPQIPLGPTYNPAFNGFLPLGGAILGTAYVLDVANQFKGVAVDANGEQQDLSFIQGANYGFAIWRGGLGATPLLAWGTQPTGDAQTSSLQISNPDGSNLQTLLTVDNTGAGPVQLVAELWSADGQSLYFSKEPVGLGGYIPFSGASNLYIIDLATKVITEVIPQAPSTSPQTCLDAISGDFRFVADHCSQNVITIRNLQNGNTATIQAPTDAAGYRLMGSARFSPAGDLVAFALAQGNPDDERGWVAVGPSSGGAGKLVFAGDAGSYYNVLGWLDDQTLLVQSISINNPDAGNQLYTVGVDGTNLTKVAEGSFLTIIENR